MMLMMMLVMIILLALTMTCFFPSTIHEGNQSFANDSSMAPNKQSAFQIAVSVAHAAENKVINHSIIIYLLMLLQNIEYSPFMIFIPSRPFISLQDSKSYGNGSKQNDNPDFDENNKFRLLGMALLALYNTSNAINNDGVESDAVDDDDDGVVDSDALIDSI